MVLLEAPTAHEILRKLSGLTSAVPVPSVFHLGQNVLWRLAETPYSCTRHTGGFGFQQPNYKSRVLVVRETGDISLGSERARGLVNCDRLGGIW